MASTHYPKFSRPPEARDAPNSSRGVGRISEDIDKSFGGFLRAVRDANNPFKTIAGSEANRTLEKVYGSYYHTDKKSGNVVTKTAMGENTGTVGGYTVPPEFALAIMEVISEECFIWPRANVVPMHAKEISLPCIDAVTATTTVGRSSLFGSTYFTWGEEQQPVESEPKFRQVALHAWDLLGYTIVSNQFLEDTGPEGEKALVRMFGKAAAWTAEYAFLQGQGTAASMPLGILNAPGTIFPARKTPGGQKIVVDDIASMSGQLLPASWRRAIWATHPTCMPQLGVIPTFFLNQARLDDGSAATLFGRPLFVTDKLPPLTNVGNTGNTGDIILFDPWLYVIGLRMEVLIDASSEVPPLFTTYQSAFRIWLRLDGKPWVSGTITLPDAVTTVSPYVALHA